MRAKMLSNRINQVRSKYLTTLLLALCSYGIWKLVAIRLLPLYPFALSLRLSLAF